jgi:hypothetical protein
VLRSSIAALKPIKEKIVTKITIKNRFKSKHNRVSPLAFSMASLSRFLHCTLNRDNNLKFVIFTKKTRNLNQTEFKKKIEKKDDNNFFKTLKNILKSSNINSRSPN